MYGILGFLIRGAREKLQERSAKNKLERKLGRKVSTSELYSLEAHLDAAQTPFAPQNTVDAGIKRPLFTKKRVIVLLVIMLLIVGALGTLAIAVLPDRTINYFNPFTPNPPDGSFPATVGEFRRDGSIDYTNEDYTVKIGRHFEALYTKPPYWKIRQMLWVFKSETEAREAFETKKKYFKGDKSYSIMAESDTRFVPALGTNDLRVIRLDGAQVREIRGTSQKTLYELEAALTNTPPAEVVEDKKETTALTVLQLLDEYQKDVAAAAKKYDSQTINISGTVEVSEKDKKGGWTIGFMRPGSTKPTDGMVVCSFDTTEMAKVSNVKKGDSITVRGKVTMQIAGTTVLLENCTKP